MAPKTGNGEKQTMKMAIRAGAMVIVMLIGVVQVLSFRILDKLEDSDVTMSQDISEIKQSLIDQKWHDSLVIIGQVNIRNKCIQNSKDIREIKNVVF